MSHDGSLKTLMYPSSAVVAIASQSNSPSTLSSFFSKQRDPLKFNADLAWASERTAEAWATRNDCVSPDYLQPPHTVLSAALRFLFPSCCYVFFARVILLFN
jgi:hypothetical protein